VSDGEGRPARPWPPRLVPAPELLERINREWRVTDPAVTRPSLKQRLARPLRRAFAVLFRPQEAFNSAVVQHLDYLRQANDVAHERQELLRAMLDDVWLRVEGLTKLSALRIDTRLAELQTEIDDLRRLPESMAARERRIEAGLTELRAEHAEVKTALGVLQHEARHLSKALAGAAPSAPQAAGAASSTAVPAVSPTEALSHKYVGFEDAFRGSTDAIRSGLAAYVPLFAGASDVLDIGCGRGEFLSLLASAGVTARGIDLNETMVEVCVSRGLDATTADALSYLRTQPDGSLGGLFAAQVVEHLQPGYLTQMLDTAFEKLRPGALIVLETINPGCWFAFFESYIRDITHERALHPDTLKYLLVASGFQGVDIRYSAPYPDHEKLQPVAGLPVDAAETLNANVEKVNRLLFTYLDYAAIGRRP
jgi:2-polyprenyl-3-methyl-5-hydroxy-6-metoxy-1,4-benzoquinol methylase